MRPAFEDHDPVVVDVDEAESNNWELQEVLQVCHTWWRGRVAMLPLSHGARTQN